METTNFLHCDDISRPLSAVMKTIKTFQTHIVENVMSIYVSQKFRIDLNVFKVNKFSLEFLVYLCVNCIFS